LSQAAAKLGEELETASVSSRGVTKKISKRDKKKAKQENEENEKEHVELTEFFQQVQVIRDAIGMVETLTDKLGHKYADYSAAWSRKSERELASEINALIRDISSFANAVRRDLRDLNEANKESRDDVNLATLSRIREAQYTALSRRYLAAISEFTSVRDTGMQQVRASEQRKASISQLVVPGLDPDEHGDGAVPMCVEETRMLQREADLSDVQARHREILRLEQSITELAEMYSDVALMVESQAESIDRIDFNVGRAEVHVERSVDALANARINQRAVRRKKIMIGTCCAGALTAVGAVVALRFV